MKVVSLVAVGSVALSWMLVAACGGGNDSSGGGGDSDAGDAAKDGSVGNPGADGSRSGLDGGGSKMDGGSKAPSCMDGVLNEGETAIDCGGPNCGPCGDGKACATSKDCTSGVCKGGINGDAGAPDAGGGGAVCASAFTLMTVAPALGPTTGGTALTFTGANFDGTTTFNIAGLPVTGLNVVSSTQITGVLPANPGKAGAFDVTATDFGRSATLMKGFTYYYGTTSFAAHVDYASAGGYELVLGDFNEDKKMDAFVPSAGTNSSSVFLGNGDGTFGAATAVAFGATGFLARTADVNGDKHLDLVMAQFTAGNVYVMLGNGDGTFKAPTSNAVTAASAGIAIADFNGDKNLDIIASGYQSGTLSLMLGNGDGTFKPATTVPSGSTSALALLTADIDGDKKADLVSVNYGGTGISVLIGNGDGTFKSAVVYGTSTQGFHGSLVDINHDKKLDVITGQVDGFVAVYLGNGDGTFGAPATFVCGTTSTDAKAADFNLDGNLDVVCPAQGDQGVDVLMGNGDGTFRAPTLLATPATGATAVGPFDLDGDGRVDIVVGGSNGLSVLMNSSQ